MKPFSAGTSVVWSAKEGKLGLIDRRGKLILPYQFQSIEPFREGLAAIRGPEGPGYITPDSQIAIHASLR
ncbi:MAG TPA: WG repeat-containing protein [Bryobacteraceae bacterium]